MKIYVGHSSNFDFKKELYAPIRNSSLNDKYEFILPHEKNNDLFSSKEFFKNECDLVIAEVSYASTGLGIELGWANDHEVPVVCIYKKDSKITNALKSVSNNFIEYSNEKELISEIEKILKSYE